MIFVGKVRGEGSVARPRLVAAMLSLAACSDEISFPSQPPPGYREPATRYVFRISAAQLRAVAGKAALDCGVARDHASADRVTVCATRALRMRRPFYCRYDPPDVSQSRFGGVWARQAAYVGTAHGTVLTVLTDRDSRIVTYQVLPPDTRDPKPLRLQGGMTPPRLTIVPPSIDTGKRQISGIVILETVINKEGVVDAARVVKLLPDGVDKAAEDIVNRSRFEPSRFFGTAVPVFYNVTVDVERGIVTLRPHSQ